MTRGLAPRPTTGSAKWCAVTRRHEDKDGWFNTGCTLPPPDPHVWISATGCRIVAKAVGWIDPAEHAAVVAENAALKAQLEQAVEEISEQRKFREQIDGLASAGMNVVKSGGRPTRQTRPEAIREELEKAA